MLNILLSVLKVIGILLAILLGLLLFLFLIVALGPVTYKANGVYREERYVRASVNWIGFVLRYKITYEEDQGTLWWFRILGVLVASNDEVFLQNKEQRRLKKEERKAKREAKQQPMQAEEMPKEQPSEQLKEICSEQPMEQLEEISSEQPTEQLEEVPSEQLSEQLEEIPSEQLTESIEKNEESEEVQTKKRTGFRKIQQKLVLIKKKIRRFIHNIKMIPTKLKKKIENLRARIERFLLWKEFFLGDENREGFGHILKHLKKMISHILPVSMQGRIEFGLEDPYVMGQVLTILSIFYPVYQDKLTLVPDFENPGFAAEGSLRGRIIPGYLLLKLIIIICNREVRRIYREGRQLIGGNES